MYSSFLGTKGFALVRQVRVRMRDRILGRWVGKILICVSKLFYYDYLGLAILVNILNSALTPVPLKLLSTHICTVHCSKRNRFSAI